MFFNKKEEQKQSENKEPEVIKDNVVLHTMPKKFLKNVPQMQTETKKNGVLNLMIFILIFLTVAGGATWFFRDKIFPKNFNLAGIFSGQGNKNLNNIPGNKNQLANKNQDNNNTDNNGNNNQNNKNANTNQPKNHNGLPNYNDNQNTNININLLNNINITNNVNNANNINNNNEFTELPIVPLAMDTDKDSLTDIEEKLYGTDVNNPDTDGDAYLDGQEIMKLYNPLVGNSEKITSFEPVAIYKNPTYKYRVYYPRDWQVVPLGKSDQEISFVSSGKEFIEVIVLDNPNGETAVSWYLKQILPKDAYKAERVFTNNFRGIKSLDGMHVYLTPLTGERNFIYSISYMIGSQTQISYPATFQMMIRSFDVIPDEKQ